MNVCFFLSSNIRSGANLSLLRHGAFLAGIGHRVSVVFHLRFYPKTLEFVGGTDSLETWYLDEYPSNAPLQDIVITNWWHCAYEMQRVPARLYSFYRHGDEKALFQDHVFDAVIDVVFRENFLWFTVTDALATDLAAWGHRPIVLPNGVDVARFAAATPLLRRKAGILRVLIEGPVSLAFKRVDATVNAVAGLSGIEIVHMAADGSRPSKPIHYALGAINHEATANVYASCDLILKLSALEAFPMPVLEQFAAGGTAVVSGFPGHDAYINASNAIVVDIDEPFDSAVTAVRMLRDDPEQLCRLKAAASRTAQRFDWLPLHRRFAEILEQSLQGRPRSPQPLPIIARYLSCQQDVFELWLAEQVRRQSSSASAQAAEADRS